MGDALVNLLPLIVAATLVPLYLIVALFLLQGRGGLVVTLGFVAGGIAMRFGTGSSIRPRLRRRHGSVFRRRPEARRFHAAAGRRHPVIGHGRQEVAEGGGPRRSVAPVDDRHQRTVGRESRVASAALAGYRHPLLVAFLQRFLQTTRQRQVCWRAHFPGRRAKGGAPRSARRRPALSRPRCRGRRAGRRPPPGSRT